MLRYGFRACVCGQRRNPMKTSDTWLRYLLFGVWYLSQSVPGAFLTLALVQYLVEGGLTKAEVGAFTAVIALPWTFKLVWAPLADKWSIMNMKRGDVNRRFQYIMLSTIFMAVVLALFPLLEVRWAVQGLLVGAFLHNMGRSFQDVATDGLAMDLLKENERGPAQTAMAVGRTLGKVVGGAGALWLYGVGGSWTLVCLAVAAFVLLSGLTIPRLLLRKLEVPVVTEGYGVFVGLLRFSALVLLAAVPVWYLAGKLESGVSFFFDNPQYLHWFGLVVLAALAVTAWRAGFSLTCALLLALLAYVGKGLTDPVVFPWFRELGYERAYVKEILAYDAWFKFGGVLLSGLVLAGLRWRTRVLIPGLRTKVAFVLANVFLAYAYANLGLVQADWADRELVFRAIMLTSVADGVYTVVLTTLFMDITGTVQRKHLYATVFAVFMAAINFSDSLTGWAGGELADQGMATADQFIVGGLVQLVILVPLIFVRLKRKQ